jgi:antitoxin component YwqK of YwqJK toxin-antitoxin module
MDGQPATQEIRDADGDLVESAQYIDGKLHGVRTIWRKGAKLAEAQYRMGELQGRSCQWYENGNLKEECFFEDGEHNGPYRSWWPNGRPKEEGVYNNGRREPGFVWYDSDGSRVRTLD